MTRRPNPRPIAESDLDEVFGTLAEAPVDPSDAFQSRVEDEIDAVTTPGIQSPGVLRIAVSTLVQTANVLLGSLCISPRQKTRAPTPTDPARPADTTKATEP